MPHRSELSNNSILLQLKLLFPPILVLYIIHQDQKINLYLYTYSYISSNHIILVYSYYFNMSVDGIPKPVMSIYIPLSLNFLSSFDACLPYKITHLSNNATIYHLRSGACLPYKITYFSNSWHSVRRRIAACLPYKITYFSN